MKMCVFGGRYRRLLGPGLLCVAALSGCGDGSKVVEMPVVTEESLSPEQRAQWEEMKRNGTATAPGLSSSFTDPAARMQEILRQEEEANKAAATPNEGN